MLQSWNNLIFENVRDKLLSAAMKFLYSERSGEAFDSQLVIGVRESFGKHACCCPLVENTQVINYLVMLFALHLSQLEHRGDK